MSKDDLYKQICLSILKGAPLEASLDDILKQVFGFKRLSGEEILLEQLIHGKSEKEAQTLPLYMVRKEVEEWCSENKISYQYNPMMRTFTFYKVDML